MAADNRFPPFQASRLLSSMAAENRLPPFQVSWRLSSMVADNRLPPFQVCDRNVFPLLETPPEMLVMIFSKLDALSVKNVSKVCVRFRHLVHDNIKRMQKKRIHQVHIRAEHSSNLIYLYSVHSHIPVVKIMLVDSTNCTDDIDFIRMPSAGPTKTSTVFVNDRDTDIAKVLNVILKHTAVDEMRIFFDHRDFTPKFADTLQMNQGVCSKGTLFLREAKITLSPKAFAHFLSRLDPSVLHFDSVTVSPALLYTHGPDSYFRELMQRNTQLKSFLVDDNRNRTFMRSANRSEAPYTLFRGIFDSDHILPTFTYRGPSVGVSVDAVVQALKKWACGEKVLISINCTLDRATTKEELCQLAGVRNLFGNRPADYAFILNVKRERLKVYCRPDWQFDERMRVDIHQG